MKLLDSISDSTEINLGKLWEKVRDRQDWHAAVLCVTESNKTYWLNNNNVCVWT